MSDIVIYVRKDRFDNLLRTKQDFWLVSAKCQLGDKIYFAYDGAVQGFFLYKDTGRRFEEFKPGVLFDPASWEELEKPILLEKIWGSFKYKWW